MALGELQEVLAYIWQYYNLTEDTKGTSIYMSDISSIWVNEHPEHTHILTLAVYEEIWKVFFISDENLLMKLSLIISTDNMNFEFQVALSMFKVNKSEFTVMNRHLNNHIQRTQLKYK